MRTLCWQVSGPPHVHDELLTQMARLSGVLMERVWRQHVFEQLVEVVTARLISSPPHPHLHPLAPSPVLAPILTPSPTFTLLLLLTFRSALTFQVATSWLEHLGSQHQKPELQRVPKMLLPGQEEGGVTPRDRRRSWREAAEEMAARAQEQASDAAERGGDLFYVRWLPAETGKYEREVAASQVGITGGRGSKPWEAAEFSAFGSGCDDALHTALQLALAATLPLTTPLVLTCALTPTLTLALPLPASPVPSPLALGRYDNALSTVRLRLLHPNGSALGMLVVESPSEKEGDQRPLPTHLLEALGALAPALQASSRAVVTLPLPLPLPLPLLLP